MAVEFVPGGSLDKILYESRVPARTEDSTYVNIWSRLTERELLRIASDVSHGMQHLESKLVSDMYSYAFVTVKNGTFAAFERNIVVTLL